MTPPPYTGRAANNEGCLQKLARVDWIGTVVFVGSTTSVLVPISWGGIMYPWDHWRILLPLVLGFAGLVGFLVWEIYGAREPLITLHVFTNRTAAVSYTGTVMHGIIVRFPPPLSLTFYCKD